MDRQSEILVCVFVSAVTSLEADAMNDGIN